MKSFDTMFTTVAFLVGLSVAQCRELKVHCGLTLNCVCETLADGRTGCIFQKNKTQRVQQ